VDAEVLPHVEGDHQRLATQPLEDLPGRTVPKHEAERILPLDEPRSPPTSDHVSPEVIYPIKYWRSVRGCQSAGNEDPIAGDDLGRALGPDLVGLPWKS
jgi:hypothetical protein